ncbi:MAG TPA: glycine betaine ABC transporter substrate-binding protein [Gemmatimonadaceae bacterium]|jgi:osmoprotectant transport system permease protein
MRTRRACLFVALGVLLQTQTHAQTGRAVVVASKPFGESYVLAEMFAQILEARGVPVQRRPGLGATEIAFRALHTGSIDLYPEYTGTGLLAVLGEPSQPGRSARDVYNHVSREFLRRFDARWLPPLGFENTYAIAVRRATADSLGLRTLSDLARVSNRLRAGLTPDFIGRPDGLPGLTNAYGVRPREVRSLLPAVKYQALAEGAVDVVDGYSTDGLIKRYDLVVLLDDKGFFPPYEAAALARNALARDNPRAIAALTELSGRLDVERMRALNERVEVAGESVESVARGALADLGLAGTATARVGDSTTRNGREGSLISYLAERRGQIARMAARHLFLVTLSLAAAIALAVPLGLALERLPRHAEQVIRAVGLLQTIPSIALLAFMLPALGIGVVPALVALFLYSLYPIVRNTYSGVRTADPAAVAAATALGMTGQQVLRYVRLPLAAPVIMAGIRTAGVIAVGTATLAAFIGAGGLGDPIVAGLALSDTRMILSGALPAAALALVVDGVLALAERLATPAR